MYKGVIMAALIGSAMSFDCGGGSTPAVPGCPLKKSITVGGITWTLSKKVPVGTFVNGDPYVVGPCVVSAISPAPTAEPARNGSVLNLDPADQGTAFDDRSKNYNPAARKYPPIALKPGDALVSTISTESMKTGKRWLSPGTGSESAGKVAAVLTCLAAPVPKDAFRPSYCDRGQKIYRADSLRWDRLPNLKRVPSMTAEKLHEWSQHFYRSPWLDVCFFGFDAPAEYMPHYAAEIGRAVGIAALFLICDFTQAEKESLMVGFVQYGIDLWGIVRGCNASRGWQAHGGHGSGRKLPMVFAGMMLGDDEMAAPTKTYPDLRIGEDMQTMHDKCWTGAKAVYTGHTGVWNGKPVSPRPTWGPYEHLHPSQWKNAYPGESYRRCCTSIAWVGQALAARLMKAQDNWDHPAFFDYCDRWMTEDDTEFNKIIEAEANFKVPEWAHQRRVWDAIVNDMWDAYRYTE